jgi:hypothetical protein
VREKRAKAGFGRPVKHGVFAATRDKNRANNKMQFKSRAKNLPFHTPRGTDTLQ